MKPHLKSRYQGMALQLHRRFDRDENSQHVKDGILVPRPRGQTAGMGFQCFALEYPRLPRRSSDGF
jgi:hypothetical protein